MVDSSIILPALVVTTLLLGIRARIDVYAAFVRGAKEGLLVLLDMLPYLCAALTATALLRETGVLGGLSRLLRPLLDILGLPGELATVLLLRPLSGSAATAAVSDVIALSGADSRAARIACVISGAGETIFFTGALYMGAAGVSRTRYAAKAALLAYAAGVIAAAQLV